MTDTNPPAAERPRNQHCMNCGDTRGGPIGHETSECTHDSAAEAVRAALKPSFRLTLAYLIQDAQQDAHPLADAAGSTGPYIVHGCVVNSAQQLKDAVRTVWKYGPALLDKLDAANARVEELERQHAKAVAFIYERAQFIQILRNYRGEDNGDYIRWQGHAEARRVLAESMGIELDKEKGGLRKPTKEAPDEH